jgi:hypothetical protein
MEQSLSWRRKAMIVIGIFIAHHNEEDAGDVALGGLHQRGAAVKALAGYHITRRIII